MTFADGPGSELATAVDTLMRKGRIPGLSVAVVHREEQLFARGYGSADLSRALPATQSTEYLWFSMSKIVTATAALALSDAGRLDLDAPAHEYVDYLRAKGTRQPSTRQLLTHTAGLANPLPLRWAHPAGAQSQSSEELLRRQMSKRRAYRYPIGGSARYSNLGYLAAGEVITVAAGLPFQEYVRKSVFDPAGMRNTGFAYRPEGTPATGYVRAPRMSDPILRRIFPAGVAGHRSGTYLALNPFYVDGPSYGGVVGDVTDAGRFLRLHLNDGILDGRRVLSTESTRAMRVLDHPGKPFDHGIGWFRRPTAGPGDWVEHFGAGAGFWNVMRLYPERGVGVVAMSNSTAKYDFEPLFALLSSEPTR
jgi:CubicO group peptidase (beta-lactamase class C family)